MKLKSMIGYALAATLCAGTAIAQELTGTLKNIKETGAITLGHRDSSIPFSPRPTRPCSNTWATRSNTTSSTSPFPRWEHQRRSRPSVVRP